MNIDYRPERLDELLNEKARRVLTAGAVVVNNRTKELISVPAPRRRMVSKSGVVYYVATMPATPGAPPRKLSGTLRMRMTYQVIPEKRIARIGTHTPYAKRLEKEDHRYLTRVLEDSAAEIYAAMQRTAT